MPEIAVADIEQRYAKAVVMYKRKPVKVKKIGPDGQMRILDLFSQREETVPFSLKDFTPPALRIGFVNVNGSVVYVTRNPIRRYKAGLSSENTSVATLRVHYPDGEGLTLHKVQEMECIELADALLNKYPSKRKCVNHLLQFRGAMAFDKQFAITSDMAVLYKKHIVGEINAGSLEITFYDGYKHLGILLDNNYEKSIRASQ